MQLINPNDVPGPFGPYSHGTFTETTAVLFVSGQVGVDHEGAPLPGLRAQADAIWKNIIAILTEKDMTINDIAKMTTFLIDPSDSAIANEVRKHVLGDHRPASSTVVVKALLRPEWLIEIEVTAVMAGQP